MDRHEDVIILTVEQEQNGVRLDVFLADCPSVSSRSYAKQLIETGCVLGEGRLKPSSSVSVGQQFRLVLPPNKSCALCAEDIQLDVLYEDEWLLVVNKPQNMVVHGDHVHNSGTLVNALLHHCGDSLSTINGVERPGIIHRLDKDTCGAILVAKGDRAHAHISAQFQRHEVKKIYHAIVHGGIREQYLEIDKPIGRDRKDRKRMAVDGINARTAKTLVNVIENSQKIGSYSYVSCQILTGRTHQIRVHMKSIGHSVVGDVTYSSKIPSFARNGQLLHAKTIGFIHPATEKYVEITAPLSPYFMKALKTLEIRAH